MVVAVAFQADAELAQVGIRVVCLQNLKNYFDSRSDNSAATMLSASAWSMWIAA